MLRLLIVALSLALLTPFAAVAKNKPSRRGQMAYAKERNKHAAKEAKRVAARNQKQGRWKVKERRKEVKRLQADRLEPRDRSAYKEHKRSVKERQKYARRHKAVHVLDDEPDPNPDSTPKPKQRGMLGSAPVE